MERYREVWQDERDCQDGPIRGPEDEREPPLRVDLDDRHPAQSHAISSGQVVMTNIRTQ